VDLLDLVHALREGDALGARQWVADAARSGLAWEFLPRPAGLDSTDMAIAAGVVELLAAREGRDAPPWTRAVPAAPEPFFLVRAAALLPRLRKSCEEEGPEPLRRRRLFAPPDFLTTV
jgi:hypothetical protein